MGVSLRQKLDALFDAFPADITDTRDLVTGFAFTNDVENRAGKLRDVFRKALLPRFDTEGQKGDKGLILEGAGALVVMTQRRNAPSMDAVSELCAKKGIALDKATDSVTTIKVSVSKLEALVELGMLKQAELDEISGSTRVLTGSLTE